jgi:hypothetical protein
VQTQISYVLIKDLFTNKLTFEQLKNQEMKKLSKSTVLLFILMSINTITIYSQNLIEGASNQVIWGKTSKKDVTLKLNFVSSIKPISITAGLDHPNGTKFIVLFDGSNTAINIGNILAIENGFDEFGDLQESFYVQIATYDFDGDKNPEIIVAVGDGLVNLNVNVFKFIAPKNQLNASKEENWKLIGDFQGQEQIIIENKKISVPYGSQGLFDEYIYSNGKFKMIDL